MKHLMIAATALAMLTASVNANPETDLNQPVSKPVPTLRSEIERGMNAALEPTDYDITNYMRASDAVVNYQEQHYTKTDAFVFGFRYKSWHLLWMSVSHGVYHPAYAQLARVVAEIDFTIASALQKSLGLSDAQVREVAGLYYVEGQENFAQMAAGKPECGACKLLGTYPDARTRAKKFAK